MFSHFFLWVYFISNVCERANATLRNGKFSLVDNPLLKHSAWRSCKPDVKHVQCFQFMGIVQNLCENANKHKLQPEGLWQFKLYAKLSHEALQLSLGHLVWHKSDFFGAQRWVRSWLRVPFVRSPCDHGSFLWMLRLSPPLLGHTGLASVKL